MKKYKELVLINLTDFQKYDLIKQLAEFNGGRFEFLNREIPAYQGNSGSEWVKLEFGELIDVLEISKQLKIKITDLPTNNDLHGGAAKFKDQSRFLKLIKDFALETPIESLEARQSARLLVEYIKKEKGITPLSGFEDVATKAFSDSNYPKHIFDSINLAGQVTYWPEHHKSYGFKPDFDIKKDGFRMVVEDKTILFDILKNAVRKHYESPIDYSMMVFEKLRAMNVAISPKGVGALLGDENVLVSQMVSQSLAQYEKHGEKALSAMVDEVELQYSDINRDTRTVGKEQGVSMLRELLRENAPKKDEPVQHAESLVPTKNNEEVLKVTSKRSYLYKWKAALDTLVERDDSLPKDKVTAKWDQITEQIGEYRISSDELSNMVNRVESVFGDLLERKSKDVLLTLKSKVGFFLKGSEPPKVSLYELIDNSLSSDKNSAMKYLASESIKDVLTDDLLISIDKNYKTKGLNLDSQKIFLDMEEKAVALSETPVNGISFGNKRSR